MYNILVISTESAKRNGITSVIENYFYDTMDDIANVFFCFRSTDCEDIFSKKYKVFYYSRTENPVSSVSFLRKIIRENKIDIVHIHGNSGTCILQAIAAKSEKVKTIILHAHNTSCNHMAIHKIMKPILNRMVTHRFACSEMAGKFLFGNRQFRVLNNAIKLSKYRYNEEHRGKIRADFGIEAHTTVIGHIGAFNYQKNHEFIIDAFREYHNAHPDSVLMLMGEGANMETIKAKVKGMELDQKVIFLGSRSNANEFLSAFDSFLFPSRFEGLGIVLLEAQACGLRCVASDNVPQLANVTGNVTYISLEASINEWEKSISASLLTLEEREKLSDQAIEQLSARGYNIEEEIEKLKKTYLDLGR